MMLNLDTLGLSASVDAHGISAPDYQTILSTLTAFFRQIYGEDAYLEPDSKDGQWIAVIALAIHDANNMAIAVFNSFSPATAQGRALENNVKINGITKNAASQSTADVVLTGQVGTQITNGVVRDTNGISWSLPSSVVIGPSGEVSVTATCQVIGAVIALPGELNIIGSPTRGWQAVTNPQAASPGQPVESDAELRIRQSRSVSLPSRTVLEGIIGAIATLPNVERYRGYENDTSATDKNGIPSHSIAIVVDGGDDRQIAKTIANKKTPGTGTYGTTVVPVTDQYGITRAVSFFRKTSVPIYVRVTLKPLAGYTTNIAEAIKSAIADYINGVAIGDPVLLHRLFVPANLNGEGRAYDLTDLQMGTSDSELAAANINVMFNQAVTCGAENVTVVTI
ncbi:baseplate J/gp47 family protein [Serratia sp. UGAL515B_01]|uniref:baseplate J/gp47 family protein n=1 Tax=Serratia sp. UGAL515B_01 TaxID=2986763 RepID=UPI002953905A|nr:baseplate J/gp47 family protein [Serratia sp. UGAL515B_01]WON78976.1 baseplate J/gp47 family protein [Serratia sp. UGAL515B_01]